MTKLQFPNESDEYRRARAVLLDEEIALRQRIANVTELRAQLPAGGLVKEDYGFDELDGDGEIRNVRLSELFEDGKVSLFLYGFMFAPDSEAPCPMCASFLDGLNGNAPHLTERINVAVTAKSPIHRVADYAQSRGWDRLRMLSSQHNSYGIDYFAEDADGDQMPMVNVFVRRDGKIHHFWGSEMLYADIEGQARHIDSMWPLWNVLDTTPDGRGTDWHPSLAR